MKFVIQRVKNASVRVHGDTVGKIGKGFTVLVGIGCEDDEAVADRYVKKMLGLRIFADENDKTNLSLTDVGGELLIISQFTLYADCRKGNRPSFIAAGKPERAKELYEYIVKKLRESVDVVETGVFGEHMEVELINDGPFTIVLEGI